MCEIFRGLSSMAIILLLETCASQEIRHRQKCTGKLTKGEEWLLCHGPACHSVGLPMLDFPLQGCVWCPAPPLTGRGHINHQLPRHGMGRDCPESFEGRVDGKQMHAILEAHKRLTQSGEAACPEGSPACCKAVKSKILLL